MYFKYRLVFIVFMCFTREGSVVHPGLGDFVYTVNRENTNKNDLWIISCGMGWLIEALFNRICH